MKKTVLAALLAFGAAAPAFASPGDNPFRRAEYYDTSGSWHQVEIKDPAMLAMMMQHARKLSAGTIITTVDGQMFIIEDFKTPTGQMMTDTLTNAQH